MATSNSPLADDAETNIDGPILEPDYNEPVEDPNAEGLPEDDSEDEDEDLPLDDDVVRQK
jgi:hypothetical protein